MNQKKFIEEVNLFWERLNLWLIDENTECPLLGKLKNHMMKFKQSLKNDKTFHLYMEQFYNTYIEVQGGYLYPNRLFESSLMLKCHDRMQNSEDEFRSMEDKYVKTRSKYEEDLPDLDKDLSADMLVDACRVYDEMERKLLKIENSVSVKLTEQRLLPLSKIRATEKTPTAELIKRYKQIVNQDKEIRKKRVYYLQKLGELAEDLLAGNEKTILNIDRFINIEPCWNEKLLGRLYRKLVDKSYIEAGRKELFVSVFLGYEVEFENLILPIRWMKTTTRGMNTGTETNISALGYLLVGLKSLSQLEEFIDISKENQQLIQDKFAKNDDGSLKYDNKEFDDKRTEILKYREQIILDSFFTTKDRKIIASVFSKADGSRFATENLRMKESYQTMLEVYTLLCDALGKQKK